MPVAVGRASPPALSADGSTIVWSTGSEIRRYVRPAAALPYERTDAFAPLPGATPPASGIVTGVDVDVSADGTTVVFVAGPGGAPYTPESALGGDDKSLAHVRKVVRRFLPTSAPPPPPPPLRRLRRCAACVWCSVPSLSTRGAQLRGERAKMAQGK